MKPVADLHSALGGAHPDVHRLLMLNEQWG
jgi:hypothetical protein